MTIIAECQDYFDDNIWFNIFKYFGNDHGLRNTNSRNLHTLDLLRTFLFTSKEDNARVKRYLQQVPQKFHYREGNLSQVCWFCRNGVMLESLDFYGKIREEIEIIYFLWMLTMCNTDSLKTMTVNFCWVMKVDKSMDAIKARTSCTSNRVLTLEDHNFVIFANKIQKASMMEYEEIVMDILTSNAMTVKTLCVLVTPDQLMFPFYQLVNNDSKQSNLENLKLNIRRGTKDAELGQTYQAISRLPNLKKLTLLVGSSSMTLFSSHWIESNSLEEIDVRESDIDYIIKQCKCPSLKVFRCKFIPQKRWVDSWIGVKAVEPITRSEIDNRIENSDYVSFDDDFYGSYTLQYQVGIRAFKGMKVPDSCKVLVDVTSE